MLFRMRSISGSILLAFLTCHILNHAFGLVSIQAMEDAHAVLMSVWRTIPGTILLGTAMLIHFSVALITIYRRRTLKLSQWEIGQIASGLLLPVLLTEHVLGTRIAEEFAGMEISYRLLVTILWVLKPESGVIQTIATLVAWTHGCLGLYFWLRTKTWYPKWHRQLVAVAVLLPVLSLAGYVSAGFEILSELNRDHMVSAVMLQAKFNAEKVQPLVELINPITFGFVLLAALPFAARFIRDRIFSGSRIVLLLPDDNKVPVPAGATALEALRAAGRPHAAVCGGRGRCTTCRVRILQGVTELLPPNDLEAAALKRIRALEGVRLACQIRPVIDTGLTPLLPATASARDGKQMGGLEGEERRVTCMFIDLRGSTKLGEEKLPYDVLFILNQFFSEMNKAIQETGGHYSQFTGDGLMALFGLTGDEKAGARAAIRCATAMMTRLESLNKALVSELPFPLQMGIGLHHGEAIVGAMGPPQAQITSAIGDTINTTARLEGLTKDHGVPLIISELVAQAADIDLSAHAQESVPVRGRSAPVTVYLIANPAGLVVEG